MNSSTDKPNLLVIVLDSTRADRLSCYGYDRPTTPHLDAIAAEGTLFEECWSESSWTLPVAHTMMTGLTPREHLAEHYRRLPAEIPTLSEAARGAGYETRLCAGNAFLGPYAGLHRGFDHSYMVRVSRPAWRWMLKYVLAYLGLAGWGGEELTGRTLRELAGAAPPWFTVLWYNDVHHPFVAPARLRRQFLRESMSYRRRLSLMDRMRDMQELAATMTDDDRRDLSDLYDAAIAHNDELLGDLREGLERLGLWDETGIIITADHGQMLGEHGLTSHGRPAGLYRQLIRVPLIVHWPGVVPAGARSQAIVQIADITETVGRVTGGLDALPGTAAERVDLRAAAVGEGRSCAVSEREPWSEKGVRRAQRENPSFDFAPFVGRMSALIEDGWHLITAQTGRDELYHYAEDPDEISDRIDEEPERARRMREELRQWQDRVLPHPATEGRVEPDDPQVRKHLEGMGYF